VIFLPLNLTKAQQLGLHKFHTTLIV